MAPPKPLDKGWTNTIDDAKRNPDWDGYDTVIQNTVDVYNEHLKLVPKFVTLNWKLIKAMVWTEFGRTAKPGLENTADANRQSERSRSRGIVVRQGRRRADPAAGASGYVDDGDCENPADGKHPGLRRLSTHARGDIRNSEYRGSE